MPRKFRLVSNAPVAETVACCSFTRMAVTPTAADAAPAVALPSPKVQSAHFPPSIATPSGRWLLWDVLTAAYLIAIHGLACLAPFTYTPSALLCFVVLYFTTGLLGVTFCFHRCLTHRSFVLPKPVEYFCAYCGVLASQSDPIEWVSHHRLVCARTPASALFSSLPPQPQSPRVGVRYARGLECCLREAGCGATLLRVGARGGCP